MIVGPNASFIGVAESEKIESVAAKMMGKDKPGGLLVYRRYAEHAARSSMVFAMHRMSLRLLSGHGCRRTIQS